jgi:diguanylate cyclase (GGDEF)-like protein/PAS domain S-box-containing protein
MSTRLRHRIRAARRTLRLRVVGLMILVALIGIASVAWNVHRDRQLLLAQAIALAQQTAVDVAHDVDAATGLALTYASLLAASPGAATLDVLACEAYAARLAAIDPAFPAFAISRTDGTPWCRFPAAEMPLDHAGAPWFERAVVTGIPTVSGFVVGRLSGVSMLIAAVPVLRESLVLGVATASWVTGSLAVHDHLQHLPVGADVLVVDGDGVIVTSAPLTDRIGTRLATGSGAERALARLGSDTPPPLLDAHLHVAAAAAHAAVVVQVPASRVYGPATGFAWRSLFQGAATMAIALLLLLVALDRWVLRPVVKMNEAVYRIAGGALDARTGVTRRDDELGTLATALDTMAEDLEAQRAVTDRLTAKLAERSERLRMLMEHSPSLVMIFDPAGRFLAVSDRAAGVLGRSPQEIIGHSYDDLLPERFADEMAARFEVVRRGTPVRSDDTLEVGGEERIYHSDLFPILDGSGAVVAIGALATDVTSERRHAEELERVATTDALTGLANRRAFTSHVDRVLARAERAGHVVAVGYLDLDGFKEVNDTFGHEAGDAVLAQVGRRLADVTRAGELVARLGGDEFTLCLERVADREAIAAAGRRVLGVFDEPFVAAGTAVRLSASLGIAVATDVGRDAETLLRNADRAMYAAKRSGTREAVYAP